MPLYCSNGNPINTCRQICSQSPVYYELEPGRLNQFCDALDKPKEALDFLNEKSSIIHFIGVVILGLPILACAAIKKLIFFTCAEKIKSSDYIAERDRWLEKDIYCRQPSYIEKFINFCITNKIKAQDCPKIIVERDTHNSRISLVAGDIACMPDHLIHDKSKSKKILVLINFHTMVAAQEFSKEIADELSFSPSSTDYLTNQTIHHYYKEGSRISEQVPSELASYVNVTVFNNWKFIFDEKAKEVLRANITCLKD